MSHHESRSNICLYQYEFLPNLLILLRLILLTVILASEPRAISSNYRMIMLVCLNSLKLDVFRTVFVSFKVVKDVKAIDELPDWMT